MDRKRFVPPLLRKAANAPEEQPVPKKPRLDQELGGSSTSSSVEAALPAKKRGIQLVPTIRRPLLSLKGTVKNASAPANAPTNVSGPGKEMTEDGEGYYNVLWRKFTNKKHKTFDGDGVLVVGGGYATLQDVSGKGLGKSPCKRLLEPGSLLSISGKEVEIDSILSKADYMAGKPFLRTTNDSSTSTFTLSIPVSRAKQFKTPLLSSTVLPKTNSNTPTPRHDPNAPDALVMPRISVKNIPATKKIVDIVVDPVLSQHLRPHQREGVRFLYEVVMGMKACKGQGAILADEMGLGKTLQTIALIWTLLKQNPIYGDQPVVKRALIVCPVTLINNWRKEFRKWLGNERIGVFVADSKANLRDFTEGKIYNVMIIGYEKLQKVQAELGKSKIDIVIADEGHRLKTEKNKSAAAIRALNTPRRVILSGTPLQNDLHEFFIMVDFVNPGLLESYSTFRKEFENPIVKSQQPGALKKDIEKGKGRSDELARVTKLFVLRRTAEILSKYLPPKAEYVIFCRPTSQQVEVYKNILDSSAFNKCLGGLDDTSLLLITMLKKLCNCPGLLAPKEGKGKVNENVTSLLSGVNPNLLRSKASSSSGKLRVLDRMLVTLKETTDEKIVIVSNYTSTLDLLQNLISARGLSFLRLDGSTPTNKRQELVDRFNKVDNITACSLPSASPSLAFLLSAKSGGAGINLIGASRLVLFDLDWNPATDLQAMARIHRDGQKKPVKIYRMLTTGCFDEKIYQRQLTKTGLADSVMDQKSSTSSFTLAELRDLFSLVEDTSCLTHDLLGCDCEGRGYTTTTTPPSPENNGPESEDDLPELEFPGLIKASELDIDKIEDDFKTGRSRGNKFSAGKRGEALRGLMEYSHVLTKRLLTTTTTTTGEEKEEEGEEEEYAEVSVEDEVLMKVIKDGKAREVSFVFQKTT